MMFCSTSLRMMVNGVRMASQGKENKDITSKHVSRVAFEEFEVELRKWNDPVMTETERWDLELGSKTGETSLEGVNVTVMGGCGLRMVIVGISI
jgi:hypothetical protein